MNKNKTSLWSAILLMPLVLCQCSAGKAEEKDLEKPNVIIIYADDLGYGDVSCYNKESKILTPHIDSLAAQGMRFTDAHSSASFCTPSRYSLLTGNYCWRTERTSSLQGGFDDPIIGKDESTLGDLFRRNGYRTAAIGKWHVGMQWSFIDPDGPREEENVDIAAPLKVTPVDQGFDYYFGTSACTSDDSPFAFIENRQVLGLPLTWIRNLQVVGDFNRETGELYYKDVQVAREWAHEKADTIFTRRAITFMEEQVAAGNRFFIYLPLSLPHIPWLPAEFVKGKSGDGPRGDLVLLADHCVGEITNSLERLGIEENTLVIFTSDNGPREGINGHRSAGELRGYKGSIYEGGHRVPFIVKWPGRIEANTVSDDLIGQIDLYATLASILDLPLAEGEAPDSYDFTPVLFGQALKKPVREEYVHHYYAMRKGDWKLIFWVEDIDAVAMNTIEADELYNLIGDPGEKINLLDQHPEIVSDLKSTFIEINNRGYSRPNPISN
jgi:arylsulfatase A-like enzyme